MKNLLASIALVAGLALAVGLATYRSSSDPALSRALAQQDALEWLRMDFQLTESQFAGIKRLHDSYSAVCAEHCRAIQEAVSDRERLAGADRATPAQIAAADRRVEELRLVCESAIATHVRQCAALMSPEAGARYLELVLPKIKDFDHLAPPTLRLNPTAP